MSPATSDDHRSPDGEGPADAGPVDQRRAPRRRTRTVVESLVAVLVITLLGLPFGLLWASVAPDVPVRKTEDGAALTQPQPEEFIAADGWFSLLGLGFGVLVAIAVWILLRRHRGPLGMILVLVGTVAAAVVAWRVGREVGLAEYRRLLESLPVGQTLNRPPDLRAGGFEWVHGVIPTLRGNVLLPAFGAAVTYTLLAGWSRYATLRAETEPDAVAAARWAPGPAGSAALPGGGPAGATGPPAVSSGFPEPPDPPAAPAPPGPGAAGPPPG